MATGQLGNWATESRVKLTVNGASAVQLRKLFTTARLALSAAAALIPCTPSAAQLETVQGKIDSYTIVKIDDNQTVETVFDPNTNQTEPLSLNTVAVTRTTVADGTEACTRTQV